MDSIIVWIKENRKFLYYIGATIAVYLIFKYLLPLFAPFVVAGLLAWLIKPTTFFLKKYIKLPYMIGGLLSLVVFVASFSTIMFFFGRLLLEQGIRFIGQIPFYLETLAEKVQGVCKICDSILGMTAGSAQLAVNNGIEAFMNYASNELIPKFTGQTVVFAIAAAGVIGIIFITLIAALLIVREMGEYKDGKRESGFYPWVKKLSRKLSDAGAAYMRVQLIVMLIIAAICSIGLYIMGNAYALLVGITIALIDALPVLGSGMILVPWTIISLLTHDYKSAIILTIIFILCQITRELLEPKLLGNKMGLRPIYALMAMFVGYKLFGLFGFLLGPYGLILIRTIVD